MRKTFRLGSGAHVHAVNGVSFQIGPGETYALIGESGSGKSTVGRLVLGLLESSEGTIEVLGRELTSLGREDLRRLRSDMQIVFQEPFESLNPRMSVRAIVEEPLILHERGLSRAARYARVIETLVNVGLGESFAHRLPKALSGGQQQRVGIARAVITQPKFIVLDEPTSSLDLSVRAQILKLLGELQQKLGLTYLFISHDISTVTYFSHRVGVMYRGQIVETGPTQEVLSAPRHPYTKALLSAALSADPDVDPPHYPLSGEIPSPTSLPGGCFLYGRCPIQSEECALRPVPLRTYREGHDVACIKVGLDTAAVPEPQSASL